MYSRKVNVTVTNLSNKWVQFLSVFFVINALFLKYILKSIIRKWYPDTLTIGDLVEKSTPSEGKTVYKLFGKIVKSGSQDFGHAFAIMRYVSGYTVHYAVQ